jgi:phytoene dehydrogenase-like protein
MKTYTVIGGGLAGLTAAIQLAKKGASVRLIELNQAPGGRASTTYKEGFALNYGPHAVYMGGMMHRTLTEWGIVPSGKQPVLGDGAYLVEKGQKHGLVRNVATLATASFLGVLDKIEAGRVLGKLTGGPDEEATGITIAEWLDKHAPRPAVRQFARALIRVSTYGDAPELQSAEAVMKQTALATQGVTYVDGGWQSIIQNLVKLAGALGVTFELGSRGREVDSNTILAISPEEVERLTGVHFGTTPIHMACLDVALEEMPPSAAIFALGLDEPLYYSVHSHWVKVAPEGKGLVHLGKYMGSQKADPVSDRAQLERFADLLMPGWKERVAYVRFLPDMAVVNGLPGVAPRPDVDALGVDGARIAGDWVGPEGMLSDAAVASGLRAADHLLAKRMAA